MLFVGYFEVVMSEVVLDTMRPFVLVSTCIFDTVWQAMYVAKRYDFAWCPLSKCRATVVILLCNEYIGFEMAHVNGENLTDDVTTCEDTGTY